MGSLFKSVINIFNTMASKSISINQFATSSGSITSMIEQGVIPDVIPFAPGDKIEVICFNYRGDHFRLDIQYL